MSFSQKDRSDEVFFLAKTYDQTPTGTIRRENEEAACRALGKIEYVRRDSNYTHFLVVTDYDDGRGARLYMYALEDIHYIYGDVACSDGAASIYAMGYEGTDVVETIDFLNQLMCRDEYLDKQLREMFQAIFNFGMQFNKSGE